MEVLDTLHVVEVPEGVELSLRAAGPVARSIAWSIDVSIRSMAYLGCATFLFPFFAELALPLTLLLVFAGEWTYPVLFEVLRDGQTPGKQVVGLRVVNGDGTPVGWSTSILRNLLMAADFLPGTYLVGLAAMLATRDFNRLGDLAAGSLVVYVDEPSDAAAPADEVPPLAPPLALEVEEQRAVIAFAERIPWLSEARAVELAELATPLHAPGEAARERLLRIAAWLRGKRPEGSS